VDQISAIDVLVLMLREQNVCGAECIEQQPMLWHMGFLQHGGKYGNPLCAEELAPQDGSSLTSCYAAIVHVSGCLGVRTVTHFHLLAQKR